VSRARRRTVHALFARVTLIVAVLFVCIVHALFSSVAGAFPRAVACYFARHARAVCALFVRDVLVVAC
jgi:hypothetical protein